jgi:hypothetical protein
MSDIKVVRMITGEDVLCKVTVGQDNIIMEDAVVIIPSSQESVQFVPYAMFCDKDVSLEISKEKFIFIATPRNEFINQHKQMFGGIVAPQSKIVV